MRIKWIFVDDENSKHLIWVKCCCNSITKTAGRRKYPSRRGASIICLSTCESVGLGGITFGLKQIFGIMHIVSLLNQHSSVLIGLLTGEKEKVSVHDFGIDNQTEGDGLAVGRPSSFASSISEKLVDGIYTIEDDELFKLLAILADSEGIYLEPSAVSGLIGPREILESKYAEQKKINTKQTTHIVWATGGALVPKEDMKGFYEKGKSLI
jgi:D-serine dehydratase